MNYMNYGASLPDPFTTSSTPDSRKSQGSVGGGGFTSYVPQPLGAYTQGASTQPQGIGAYTQGASNNPQGVGAYTQGASTQGVGAYTQGVSTQPQGVGSYTQGVSTQPPQGVGAYTQPTTSTQQPQFHAPQTPTLASSIEPQFHAPPAAPVASPPQFHAPPAAPPVASPPQFHAPPAAPAEPVASPPQYHAPVVSTQEPQFHAQPAAEAAPAYQTYTQGASTTGQQQVVDQSGNGPVAEQQPAAVVDQSNNGPVPVVASAQPPQFHAPVVSTQPPQYHAPAAVDPVIVDQSTRPDQQTAAPTVVDQSSRPDQQTASILPVFDQSGRPDQQQPTVFDQSGRPDQQQPTVFDQSGRADQQTAYHNALAKALELRSQYTPGTDPLIDPTRYGDSTALAMDPILDYTGRLEEPLIKEVETNLGAPGYNFTEAGDNTLLSSLEGQYGLGGAGQLGKTAITQDPNSLQSALLGGANRIDAANPYDTRRDDIIAGQDSEVDRLYDQEFARIQNEFAVNNNLGSPAYTQALQDMQDQKARAKLGIRSEFGRTAAAQDESMARGRLDDITGAINTSRAGQVSEEAIQANRRAGAQATGGYMGTTEFDQDLRGSALEEGVRRGRVQDTGQALDRERSHVDRQMMYQQQLQQAANDEYFRALKAEEDAMYRPFQYQDAGLALAGGALGSPGTDMAAAIGGYGSAAQGYGNYGQARADMMGELWRSVFNTAYDG